METERQKIVVKFADLWPFLKNQEEDMLARMKETEEQMEGKKVQHIDRLADQPCYVRELIQEIEMECELPAIQLLQVR